MIYKRISLNLVLLLMLICCAGLVDASVNIAPIGDSITRGSSSSDDGQDHATYRYWLWQHLHEGGYDVDFVGSTDQPHLSFDFDQDHEGHSGYRACDLITGDRLKHWVSGYNPDIALVQLGTNDVMTGVPMENTISSLDEIIDVLRENNPKVVILMGTVIPREGYLEKQQILNHAIEDLAGRKSTAASPVVAVDLFSGYDGHADNQPPIYLHPNEQGEQKIADRYYAALVPYLSAEKEQTETTQPTESPTTGTPVPTPASTQQTIPQPTQEQESVISLLPTQVSAVVPVQVPETEPVPASTVTGAWPPTGGGQKQYLIGDCTFQSPVQTGGQSGWTPALGSSSIRTWPIVNSAQQTSEPPARLFVRWYPERSAGSPLR